MRDFESDIAELIAAAGLGTIGEDLFIGGIPPDVTGRICTVVISDSVDVLPYVSTDRDQVTAQISVTVRGLGGRDAGDDPLGTSRARAMAALTACHRAVTNIYSRIVALDLPALEWNSNELPEWTFTLELACDSVHAVTELVVLPREGLLRLVGVSFPDGSTLTSAPPPVDLSGYATLDGAETLSGKTLASPIVTGPLLPATAGQQALGSAAVPWRSGSFDLPGVNAAESPLTATHWAGGFRTGRGSAGGGSSMIAWAVRACGLLAGTAGSIFCFDNGGWFGIQSDHRINFPSNAGNGLTIWKLTADGKMAVAGTNLSGYTPTERFEVHGGNARMIAGDVQFDRAQDGVILRSPNGTRYRITVADDGTLSTSPA